MYITHSLICVCLMNKLTEKNLLFSSYLSVMVFSEKNGISENTIYAFLRYHNIKWPGKMYAKVAHLHRIATNLGVSFIVIEFLELLGTLLRTVKNFPLYDILPDLKGTIKKADYKKIIMYKIDKAIDKLHQVLKEMNINNTVILPFVPSQRFSSIKKNSAGKKIICSTHGNQIHEITDDNNMQKSFIINDNSSTVEDSSTIEEMNIDTSSDN